MTIKPNDTITHLWPAPPADYVPTEEDMDIHAGQPTWTPSADDKFVSDLGDLAGLKAVEVTDPHSEDQFSQGDAAT